MSLRIVITGATGFVGPVLIRALRRLLPRETVVVATAQLACQDPLLGTVEALDVTDRASVTAILVRHRPTHIVNLAGISAPPSATRDPRLAWSVHLDGAVNLAEVILGMGLDCRLVNVGSGLVYGASARPGHPLDESARLDPVDIYAVTKAAADLALGVYARKGLKCVRLRPFNHTGPGQSTEFAVPSFAMQIARIEVGLAEPVIRVGNLDSCRDFLDVEDVAEAYALAALRADELEPGEILNVASGTAMRMSDVLDGLLALSRASIAVVEDPDRVRRSDLAWIAGDARRLRDRLGWSPRLSFEATLLRVLEACRARCLAAEPAWRHP
jgi:GDP-4-dehydro-6-deoxy-D-mannose reductase